MAKLAPVKFIGGEKLEKALKELGTEAGNRILEKALRPGANVLKDEMARRAPRKTGALSRSIIVRKLRNKTMEVELGVGPSRDAFYGLFVEFGTGPRKQRKTGKDVGAMPADPFARPAYDAKKEDIQSKAAEILKVEIANAARKVSF